MKPRILSLFSGGGGLDIGFANAGFEIVASSDVEKHFCESLSSNSKVFGKKHRVFCKDIAELNAKDCDLGSIDFVIGGPPCQSFSAAGRRAGGVYGLNDLRGSLFWHYCRLLEELQPRGFLFENVRGILSANNNEAWGLISKSFGELGYSLSYRVLDAAEFGVPQHRDRVILVGTKDQSSFLYPRPTHGPASRDRRPYVTASEAIADLQDPSEEYKPYGGKYEDLLLQIPPGSNYLFFTEKMSHPEPKFAWRSRFSDFLYVADPNQPTRTIVAHPGKWAGPFHWRKRKFTIAELKRLFTFPDDYELAGGEMTQIRQLGNSVAPRLGFNLAQAVQKQIFGLPSEIELISDDFKFDLDKRKARRARSTKSNVKTNTELFNFDQLDLFAMEIQEFKEEKQESFRLAYSTWRQQALFGNGISNEVELFECNASLAGGQWLVKITGRNPEVRLKLDLTFIKPIQDKFTRIVVELDSCDVRWIGVAWDAVNWCVQNSTSYENLHKLYGHFTEPYPQFSLKFESSRPQVGLCRLQEQLCDFSYLSKYHNLSELTRFLGSSRPPVEHAKLLRELGYDVRTNETNRTVAEGKFRICYPFTVAINSKNFVTWREKGTHKTADRTSIPNGG
jgi:DNA (cytosine-5)-methyltransferase 1